MRSVILVSGAIAGLILFAPTPSRAEDLRGEIEAIVKDYLASHPDELGEIIKGYMIKHPEVASEILAEALKQSPVAIANSAAIGANSNTAAERGAAVASNAKLLFSSSHQVTLGNPDGDVTLVEFFDYNCGFCKRALPDMLILIKDDPKLKIVLKEFPILGPSSIETARVAIAVRMQDLGGQKYLAFHQELLSDPGSASKEKALAVAKDQGLDMARLEQDMASDEVAATLTESTKLADALGITGTPGYVIGKDVVLGAVGVTSLQAQIETARGQVAN
jgi:protein-disulfide isomerase